MKVIYPKLRHALTLRVLLKIHQQKLCRPLHPNPETLAPWEMGCPILDAANCITHNYKFTNAKEATQSVPKQNKKTWRRAVGSWLVTKAWPSNHVAPRNRHLYRFASWLLDGGY
jgi:hypothetical protein